MPPHNDPDPFGKYEPRRHVPDHLRWQPIYQDGTRRPQDTDRPRPRTSRGGMLVALLLFVLAVVLVVAFFPNICAFFSMIGRLADNPTESEALLGMWATGIALVAILAVLKIVLQQGNANRPR